MAVSLENWLGKTEEQTEVASAAHLEKLSALLDHQTTHWGEVELPPLAHWIFCQAAAPQSKIDEDGHPKRGDPKRGDPPRGGGFIPPIDLPRRMWASSDVVFHQPLRLGEEIVRRSTIKALARKTNKSGEPLVFLTIEHKIMNAARTLCVEEAQHIVYKSGGNTQPITPPVSDKTAEQSKEIIFDVAALFRYSAISFNAHRIHYDRDYAKVEGYPGLVVHGPLLAFLLLDFYVKHKGQVPDRFSFRALSPLFEGQKARLCLAGKDLWIETSVGANAPRNLIMKAEVS